MDHLTASRVLDWRADVSYSPEYIVSDESKDHHHVNGGSSRARNRSSSLATNPYIEVAPQQMTESLLQPKGNRSPTPSVRFEQARAFAAQHASPPGLRVTAGGKIVHDGSWQPSAAPPDLTSINGAWVPSSK